mgnify:CR=1 FL=1
MDDAHESSGILSTLFCVMENENRSFFDGNPKMIFVFGLVAGIALTSLMTNSGLLGNAVLADSAGTIADAQPVAAAAKKTAPIGDVPEVTTADHILGNKDAKVTFIEYSDFECPFCKKFEPTVQQIIKEYGDKVRVVYRHFPLSFHPNAQKEAEATECANDLGGNTAFWEYHDAILDRTPSGGTGFALDALVPLAVKLGLDESKFQDCLDTNKYAQHVKDDMSGGSAAGISGTPGSVLIDASGDAQLISGAVPFATIKTSLDAAISAK